MYSSVQPGTQMGVHVSPLVIEFRAIMKLKMTVTSENDKIQVTIALIVTPILTFGLDLIKFVREYIDHVKTRDHHAKTGKQKNTMIRQMNGKVQILTYASFDGRSAALTASLKTSRAPSGILRG